MKRFITIIIVAALAASLFAAPALAVDSNSPGAWMVPWDKSVTARLTQGYDSSYSHNCGGFCIDFGVPMNTPIYAPTSGAVVEAGYHQAYGYYIKLRTDDGYDIIIAHNTKLVSGGGNVRQGDLLSYSGTTGNSTGPHLHFEVRLAGKGYGNSDIRSNLSQLFGLPLSSFKQSQAGKLSLKGQSGGVPLPAAPGSMTVSPAKSECAANEDVILNWSAASGAKWYGLTVRNNDTSSTVWERDYLTGTSVNIGKLPIGNYRFAMRGYSQYEPYEIYGPVSNLAYFRIKSADVPASIISVSPDRSAVTSGESVNIYVKTNSAANSVELINERGEHCAGAYSPYNTLSNGDKEWNVPWQTSTAGNRSIKARAHIGNNFDGAYAEKTFSLTVQEGVVVKTLEIVSIAVANPEVYVGEYVWMTVVTSSDITGIWITNETGGDTIYDLVRSYPVGNNKGWDIGWQLGRAGNRTGYVVASNGSATTQKPFYCTAYGR
ncbi:MAG: M23 family metallopeptidase [Oscillospiraceae bacterium]|jgi:murein DD-endopeptidase MepM/ murein hydrolase activator NlpD|nr:M23 family metallopeptidase [Oscillospiraceae bacterium]